MAAIIQRTEIDRQETDCVLPVFFLLYGPCWRVLAIHPRIWYNDTN